MCVTLIKKVLSWNSVASAWKRRGDAAVYGDNLVRDGLAVEIPLAQVQKADIVVAPRAPGNGNAGHIAIADGAGGVYESNYTFPLRLSHRDNLRGFTKAYRPTFYNNNIEKGDDDMKNFKINQKPDTRWLVRADGTLNNVVDGEQVRILDYYYPPVSINEADLGTLLDALKIKH
jgi:hypothetical protein